MKTFIKDVSKTVIRASIILLVMYAQRDIMVDIAKILVLIIVYNAQGTVQNAPDVIQRENLVTNVLATLTNARDMNLVGAVSNVKILVGIRK